MASFTQELLPKATPSTSSWLPAKEPQTVEIGCDRGILKGGRKLSAMNSSFNLWKPETRVARDPNLFNPHIYASTTTAIQISYLNHLHSRNTENQSNPNAAMPKNNFMSKFPFASPFKVISSIFSAKTNPRGTHVSNKATPAEIEFNTSSRYPVPSDWKGSVFKLRDDYPTAPLAPDFATWAFIDFRKDPETYANAILEYCLEGNVETDWVVQKNKTRGWFHPPWLHYSPNGREPLRGLTFERPTPPLEFAKTQTEALQNLAIGFYNKTGASVFGQMWKDPNEPNWNNDIVFPLGTVSFKLTLALLACLHDYQVMMTTATDEQVPTMKGSPGFQAAIAQQSNAAVAPSTAKDRNSFPSPVRLFQVDLAVRDDRSPIGWVFGTFMYVHDSEQKNPWERLVVVGLQWGDDPNLTQRAFDAGARPVETWINPYAEVIRKVLGGKRPSWGWNGRLNGPADNFISSCASCHSMARSPSRQTVPPKPKYDAKSKEWIPADDSVTMQWFRNSPADTVEYGSAVSADYSLQLKMGFANFQAWKK
ncbi:hypothetical protein QFC21_000693 [Naganishia friedmannii]|uniref:Uncharacterized protein n=1 Tax=Naganishia friedmannii TaxID=89922 RepID=A0ACC2WD12_9TREE|nr:hypothetical protein QFC21_000693 [Naganishia friedmannii]